MPVIEKVKIDSTTYDINDARVSFPVPISQGGTEGTSRTAARQNLALQAIFRADNIDAKRITESGLGILDLNEIIEPGTYYTVSSTEAAAVLNKPEVGTWSGGFKLYVINANNSYVMQLLIPAYSGSMYIRKYNGTTWKAWENTSETYTGTSPISVSGLTISHATTAVTVGSVGDTANQTPSWGATFKVPSASVNNTGHLTALADHTVKIPNAVATTATYGLMSATDKTKLDGIAAGAEVNQNAFSNVKVGSTTVAADTKTDTLELAGSNVTLTPDATNDKVTIGITKDNVTTALGYTPVKTNTDTYVSGLTWIGGTTAGPVPNISRAGTTTTAVTGSAIPVASSTASGVVTTGAQTFSGRKTITLDGANIDSANANRYVRSSKVVDGSTTTVAYIRHSMGGYTTISTGQLIFGVGSPNDPNDSGFTGNYERYNLPVVATGLTASVDYNIFTNKDYDSLVDIGASPISTRITADGVDLNTYTTVGSYYCTGNRTVVNGPISTSMTAGYRFWVIQGGSVTRLTQIFKSATSVIMYSRISNDSGSTWAAWYPMSITKSTVLTALGTTTSGTGFLKEDGSWETVPKPTTWTWSNGTTSGPTASLTGNAMTAVSIAAIPAASATASGVVTTGSQTFSGLKRIQVDRLQVYDTRSNVRKQIDIQARGNGPTTCMIINELGSSESISTNYFIFRQYSPQTTPDVTVGNYWEGYRLPTPEKGMTDNATYNIWTTKTMNVTTTVPASTTGYKLGSVLFVRA